MSASNCTACGTEFDISELKTVQLPKFGVLSLCDSCHTKTAGQNLKDASDLLNDIEKIARTKKDPEERLNQIKSLLSG